MPQFQFSTSRRRYVVNGRIVPSRRLTRWAQETTDASEEYLRQLAEQLNAGEIDEREFQQAVEDEIGDGHAAMAAAALGGLLAVSVSLWRRVTDYIKQQLGYFYRFTQQRTTGQTSQAENEQRAAMYGAALYSTFANGTVLRESEARDELDHEDRLAEEAAAVAASRHPTLTGAIAAAAAAATGAAIGTALGAALRGGGKCWRVIDPAAQNCADCLDWAGEWTLDDVPPIGSSVCGANCRCTIEFEAPTDAAEE